MYEVDNILNKFREYHSYKQSVLQEWRLIRSLYKGEFWKIFKKHLKEYTITPDWNYFEYVVQAYLNSVYSGAFIGTISPVRTEDEEAVDKINAFVAYNWSKWGMKNKYLHIGENAELHNLGAVRVDWKDNNIILKAISPQEVYFDPSVSDYKEGDAIFLERSVNISVLKADSQFTKGVEKYLKTPRRYTDKTIKNKIASFENVNTTENKTVSLLECFLRNDAGGIDQVFILDEEIIIYENLDMPITEYPVVCYSPQRPDGNPYGSTKLTKILNSVIALNLLDSMEATQPHRILNRVRFVNIDGRINMRSFADYGNTPGASFQTKGDPSGIVYYKDVPTIPDQTSLKNRIENSIFQVTGVDPYYKGRTTNSLQTTGATQAFQARVTMLTDNSRIVLLEEFCETLTRTILEFYFAYGGETEYHVPQMSESGTNKVVNEHKLIFDDLAGIKFNYTIAASTLLPMNQANLFESAKALYEMQGQYGLPQMITPQDLIRWSDFPQKAQILQRLEKDKQSDTAENLISDLTNFASIFSKLLAQGLSEEEAAQQAIAILIEEKNAMLQDPGLGQGFR